MPCYLGRVRNRGSREIHREVGCYTVAFPRLHVHVIDAARLNPDGRWGILRYAMAVPEDPNARVAELLGDPRASIVTKRKVLEAAVNKRIESTPNERRVTYESVYNRGLREGKAEAKRLAQADMKRSLLAIAEALGLNVDELAQVDDIDILEARVLAAAKAAR